MYIEELTTLLVEKKIISSQYLKRDIIVDFYLPKNVSSPTELSLLLINDGQDLIKMRFKSMLEILLHSDKLQPVLCVGIHAGTERKLEYGTANALDYKKRGSKAKAYNQFILKELLPYIHFHYKIEQFKQQSFAGFSLGGLTAIDMVWNYPNIFSVAGVFSGSLWWRSKALNNSYNEETDRIIHKLIRDGNHVEGLKFFFSTGSLDEVMDRNNNGIIDSIDDTLGLIEELKKKGYTESDIKYINFEDGKHDVETWGRAMPEFLTWGWGTKNATGTTALLI
jgi:enterochelin esterase-like enzyme